MSEENKSVIRRLLQEVWNQGNVDTIDEIVATDYVDHTPAADIPGREAFKQLVKGFHVAFPDIRFTLEDLIAEGDKVVARWAASGTHRGDLMGIAPTGKQMMVTGVHMYRLADGKLVERWGNWDQLGMLQRLGVIP